MKKKLLQLFLGIFFLTAFGITIYFYVDYQKDTDNQIQTVNLDESIRKEAFQTDNTVQTDESIPRNFQWDAIQKQNEDIIAWITVPNTKIDYPILQTNDNEFYLTHDYKKNESIYGAIFADYSQPRDFSALNTFIYGHNVSQSIASNKFGDLVDFLDQNFLSQHHEILLYTPNKIYTGTILYVSVDGAETRSHDYSIETQEQLNGYLEFMKSRAITKIDTDRVPDKLITLWTCYEKEYQDSNGENLSPDKSRVFVTVSLEESS